MSYDPAGRLKKVWQPGETVTGPASIEYDYFLDPAVPVNPPAQKLPAWVSATSRDDVNVAAWPSPTWTVLPPVAYTLLDGFGRTRQTQRYSPTAGIVVADTRYDERGHAAAHTLDFQNATTVAPGSSGIVARPAGVSEHRYVYDELGRTTTDQLYAATVLQWQSSTTFNSNTVTSVSPKGVSTTTTFDGHGNVSGVDELQAPAPVAHTSYQYTARQELSDVTDTAGNVTHMDYDWLGRRTKLQDPDQGTSTFSFDGNGNIATQTDARNITLAYVYDNFDRATEQHQTSTTGALLNSWTYNTTGANVGLLASKRSYANGQPYDVNYTGYDARGRVIAKQYSFPTDTTIGITAQSYTYGYGYDSADHLISMTYPGFSGLAGETVNARYGGHDHPMILTGASTYVRSVTDDALRRTSLVTQGPAPATAGAAGFFQDWYYDAATQRLATSRQGYQDTSLLVRSQLDYGYDQDGNVTTINEPGIERQCFNYDARSQLINAWTTLAGNSACNDNGTAPQTTAAPYTQQFTYNNVHAITARKDGAVTNTYTYPPTGPNPPNPGTPGPRPHAPSVITPSGGTSSPTSTTYEAENAAHSTPTPTVESIWAGYTGTGSLGAWGAQGEYVTFNVAATAGAATLVFRYAAGNGPNNRKLTINGVAQTITFPATTNWATWATFTVPVTLNAAANTVTLTYDTNTGSSDYLNLDNLVVQQAGTTTTTNTTYEAETATHTTPNPFAETSWPGYTGTGSLGGWGAQGQTITFNPTATAGAATLVFRYTAGNNANNRRLTINATNQTITFPITNSWSTWSTYSVPVTLTAGTNTVTLAYDTTIGSSDYINLDNLVVQQTTTTTNAQPTSFTYDNNGNRLTQTIGTTTTTYTYDPTNRLTTIATNTTGTPTSRNVYDADGQRLARRDPDGTTTLYLDNQELTITGPTAPTATRYYDLNGMPVATRTPTEFDYTAVDRQGSLTNTLNATNNTDTRHRRYLPYGTPRTTANTPGTHTYINQTLDPTTLTYLNNRYYDTTNALFAAVDPLVDMHNPAELSPYQYSLDNPASYSDPNGTRCHDCETATPTVLDSGGECSYCDSSSHEYAHYYLLNQSENELWDLYSFYANMLNNIGEGNGVEGSKTHEVARLLPDRLGAPALYDGFISHAIGAIGSILLTGEVAGGGVKASAGSATESGGASGIARSCASFRSDTLVVMADGTKKRISEIEIGDRVLATDPVTGKTSFRTVTATMSHDDDDLLDLVVRTESGVETIHTTAHHKVWDVTRGEWSFVLDLLVGDGLKTADGRPAEVRRLVSVAGHSSMLDLTVEIDHTFYVDLGGGAVLVHNASCFPFGGTAAEFEDEELAQLAHQHAGAGDIPGRPSVNEIEDAMKNGTATRIRDGANGAVQFVKGKVTVIINEANPFRSSAWKR